MTTEPVCDAHPEKLTRSSELLEILHRLQPGGGDQQNRPLDLQPDMVTVATALADLEAEVEAIIERGRQTAEIIHRQALADVRRIDGEVARRTLGAGHDQPEVGQRSIMQQATVAAERARRDADAEISKIVAVATALVWDTVTSPTTLRVA